MLSGRAPQIRVSPTGDSAASWSPSGDRRPVPSVSGSRLAEGYAFRDDMRLCTEPEVRERASTSRSQRCPEVAPVPHQGRCRRPLPAHPRKLSDQQGVVADWYATGHNAPQSDRDVSEVRHSRVGPVRQENSGEPVHSTGGEISGQSPMLASEDVDAEFGGLGQCPETAGRMRYSHEHKRGLQRHRRHRTGSEPPQTPLGVPCRDDGQRSCKERHRLAELRATQSGRTVSDLCAHHAHLPLRAIGWPGTAGRPHAPGLRSRPFAPQPIAATRADFPAHR
ncbi:hypothetical protein SUDANB60_06509 (plasmid) [Streptomyces sp. enrichment culture]